MKKKNNSMKMMDAVNKIGIETIKQEYRELGGIKAGNRQTQEEQMKKQTTDEGMIEMVKFCNCGSCKDKDRCNGIDLMNCYIVKKGVFRC